MRRFVSILQSTLAAQVQLVEFIKDQIWTGDYPIKYPGIRFNARMCIVRLDDGGLMLHSPGDIDDATATAISRLGPVSHIVAPGYFHHMYIAQAQKRYPAAETYICPGIERKIPSLQFDWILGPRSPAAWCNTIDQHLIRGTRFIWEVAMVHKPTRTLLLVDAIENFTSATANVSWQLKALWRVAFHMWNSPKPAPEYQLGWKDKSVARASLTRILEWEFDKIILSHGENITEDAKATARRAWTPPLQAIP